MRGIQDSLRSGCRGCAMVYQLKFIDPRESVVLVSNIDTPNDESAVQLCSSRCLGVNLPAELYEGDRYIVRITPLTARLYLAITADYQDNPLPHAPAEILHIGRAQDHRMRRSA